MLKLLKSLWQSLKNSFATNKEVQKLESEHPQATNFIKTRLDTKKFTGLPLTILVVAFLYVFLLFVGAIKNFITSDMIVSVDLRVSNLFYAFRDVSTVKVFLWITLLGESTTIITFGLLTSLFLFLSRMRWHIAALWLSIIGSASFAYITKLFFHRRRPVYAVYAESSASFPSGHATIAVAFYGFITYLLLRNVKNKKYRALSILVGLVIIAAIGFSRIYLGVHYVSDVWAGYLVGLLWLIISISVAEWQNFHERRANEVKIIFSKYNTIIKIAVIVVAVIFYIIHGLLYRP